MNFPCTYFNGASQGTPPRVGSRGIFFLSQNQSLKFKARSGMESNKFSELMVLKLDLKLAQESRVLSHLQVYGDLHLVIQ